MDEDRQSAATYAVRPREDVASLGVIALEINLKHR